MNIYSLCRCAISVSLLAEKCVVLAFALGGFAVGYGLGRAEVVASEAEGTFVTP